MGNLNSKYRLYDELRAEDIEAMYAARAATASARSQSRNKFASDDHDARSGDTDTSEEDAETTSASPDTEHSEQTRPPREESVAVKHMADALRGSIPYNTVVSAACHITKAMHAFRNQAIGAFEIAIAYLRKIGIIDLAKIVRLWIKEHPWETAAIVVPLIMLACSPAILGALGFTAGGIAAGSAAAGIQAGIGSVAAGSLFSVCTSAMMGGAGGFIIFGGVWGVSTTFMGGIALWKRQRGTGDSDTTTNNNGEPFGYLPIEDMEDDEDNNDFDSPKTETK